MCEIDHKAPQGPTNPLTRSLPRAACKTYSHSPYLLWDLRQASDTLCSL